MPLLHCVKCHHEWETAEIKGLDAICDWCGSHAYVLDKTTPLERLMKAIEAIGIKEFFNVKNNKRK